MEYREIICLANSIKFGGRCIAGKDTSNLEWVRPVSETQCGELSEEQIKDVNSEEPNLLEIIKIPFKSKSPKYYQPENIIIGNKKWQKMGHFQEERLDEICDNPPTLWDNNSPDSKKISLSYLKSHQLTSSLLLVRVGPIRIVVRLNYEDEKKYRAAFNYNEIEYDLPITDPKVRIEYESRLPGSYQLNEKKIYLCISLGEPFKAHDSLEEAYCYKLVAAIIRFNK